VEAFAQHQQAGVHTLSRLQHGTAVAWPDGTRLDLLRVLQRGGPRMDLAVLLGVRHRLPVRLLALRVPHWVADQRRRRMREEAVRRGQTAQADRLALASWTILVTTVPIEQLSVDEALVVARARWQIELLFRLWKERGVIDEWRSAQPARILAEVYATLIGLIIQHWVLLLGPWQDAACSLVKAAAAVRAQARQLAWTIGSLRRLGQTIRQTLTCAGAAARQTPRRKRPNAYQCWLDPALGSFA
jgi:hypothetical protein